MSYHSHKLNSTHSHIIGRTDPITGDSVKENDTVVFCAVCKSCFLEDSWKYMSERHCEQNQTLKTVPTLPSRLILKKTEEEILAELKNRGVNSTIVFLTTILTFLFSFFGLSVPNTFFAFDIGATFIASLFATVSVAILSSSLNTTKTFNKMVGGDKNDIRLFRNRIEIGKDSFLWNDIKQIKFQRELVVSEHNQQGVPIVESYTPFLLIYFKEGKFVNHRLPTDNYERNEKFLLGLEKISHFTEVFFYSENFSELRTMNSIQSNSNGNIQIGKPKKTVDYHGRVVFTTLDE